VAHYIFNFASGDADAPALREQAAKLLRLGMWGVASRERHRDALSPGDLVLVYLGAPEREFVGRAEIASAARAWTPSEAEAYSGQSDGGVLLARIEKWHPPVPMRAVLSEMDSAEKAKADFETGVVRITANEYETALAVAARYVTSTR
jgi:EVE domain